MSVLEPTAADIKGLDDGQLRRLVVRLCEAEAFAQGAPGSSVTAGGHDAAKDGGIDVRLEGERRPGGYLPLGVIGLQVKATEMPERAIRREMRPKDVLRPAIAALAARSGNYIIACSRADHAHAALQKLRDVMRDCLSDLADAERLSVDFYDASRFAAWAARHLGVAAWLLGEAGRDRRGWYPYGPWSNRGEPEDARYLKDDESRLVVGDAREAIAAEDGLTAVRGLMAVDRAAVRLLGLSGMGKTRFAQALFDDRVGDGALPPTEVLYGDAGAAPDVPPLQLARSLARGGEAVFLVVDNCEQDLHRKLVEVQRDPAARFRLLTIDFDVAPDRPDHTTVITMSPAGAGLIDDLLRVRAPRLTHQDRVRIVTFAQGNTRIALALAGDAEPGSLAPLQDQQLLDRLFLAERRPDPELRDVAQVAALAYPIEEDPEGVEVAILANLAGVSPTRFRVRLADLVERGLAQRRGVQTAILPPALALLLAREALARFGEPVLMREIYDGRSPRLAGAAARQLGHLHDVAAARRIAARLLASGGRYASPEDDEDVAMTAVYHLAQLDPAAGLRIAEALVARLVSGAAKNWHNMARRPLVALLRGVAMDARRFPRAIDALMTLASLEADSAGFESVRGVLPAFFRIAHSGTQASPSGRFAVLSRWIAEGDPARAALVRTALSATLDTTIHPPDTPSFAAGPRGQPWAPATSAEQGAWLGAAIETLAQAMTADPEHAPLLRRLYQNRFPDLATTPGMRTAAIAGLRRLSGEGYDPQAWFAVCRALHRIRPRKPAAALIALEAALRPVSLDERFETWVAQPLDGWEDPDDPEADNWEGVMDRARRVGAEVATEPEAYARFVRRALTDHNVSGYLFAEGLAAATSDPEAGWRRLTALAREAPPGGRAWTVVAGYLHAVRKADHERTETWLDELAADPTCRSLVIPIHATGGALDVRGVARLLGVLEAGVDAEVVRLLQRLQFGDLPAEAAAPFLGALLDADDLKAALHLFWTLKPRGPAWPPTLIAQAERVLQMTTLALAQDADHVRRVVEIAEQVLVAPGGEAAAQGLLDRLAAGFAEQDRSARPQGVSALGHVLFTHFPRRVLDTLGILAASADAYDLRRFLRADDQGRVGRAGVETAPLELVLAWVDEDLAERAPIVADIARLSEPSPTGLVWTPLAQGLFDRPGLSEIALDTIEMRLASGFYAGGIANRFRERANLLLSLEDHPQPGVRRWAVEAADRAERQALEYDAADLRSFGRFD